MSKTLSACLWALSLISAAVKADDFTPTYSCSTTYDSTPVTPVPTTFSTSTWLSTTEVVAPATATTTTTYTTRTGTTTVYTLATSYVTSTYTWEFYPPTNFIPPHAGQSAIAFGIAGASPDTTNPVSKRQVKREVDSPPLLPGPDGFKQVVRRSEPSPKVEQKRLAAADDPTSYPTGVNCVATRSITRTTTRTTTVATSTTTQTITQPLSTTTVASGTTTSTKTVTSTHVNPTPTFYEACDATDSWLVGSVKGKTVQHTVSWQGRYSYTNDATPYDCCVTCYNTPLCMHSIFNLGSRSPGCVMRVATNATDHRPSYWNTDTPNDLYHYVMANGPFMNNIYGTPK